MSISHDQSSDELSNPDTKIYILLVEDDEVNTEVITDILDTLGYSVDIATNGQRALDIYDNNRHALILMDCEMPFMNGYDASRQIRKAEHNHNLAPVPIIALTAHTASESSEKCIANGMSDFLSKPVNILMLQTKLNKWLDRYYCESTQHRRASLAGKNSDSYISTGEYFTAIIDHEVLNKLRKNQANGKSSLANRIINIYLAQSSSLITELLAAVQSANLKTVMRITHTLKSSSKNVGAINFSELCRKAENLCEQGKIDDLLIDQILSAYSEVDDALICMLDDCRK